MTRNAGGDSPDRQQQQPSTTTVMAASNTSTTNRIHQPMTRSRTDRPNDPPDGTSDDDDDTSYQRTIHNYENDRKNSIQNQHKIMERSVSPTNTYESPIKKRDTSITSSTDSDMDYVQSHTSTKRTTEVTSDRYISKNQMRDFREAFRLFDKDGDGCITKEELGNVMRSLGQFARVEELQELLLEIDVDGDGNVSFEEFVEILSNMTENTTGLAPADQEERELRDAFRVFDKHNRGYITASDLRAVLQCLGEDIDEDEIEDMIKEVDVDGDGRIDFYEFVRALGQPEDSQENDDEDETTSPLPTPKSPQTKIIYTFDQQESILH